MACTLRLPSASKLELLDFCAYFPKLAKDESDIPGEKAQTGKLVHAMIEHEAIGGTAVPEPLADVAKALKIYKRFKPWWEKAQKGRVFWPEVACLYDVVTGKVRFAPPDWHKLGRPRADSEIACIIDTLHVSPDMRSAVLLDYKTGKKTTRAEVNKQLLLGALCVYRLFDVSEVKIGLAYLRQIKDPIMDIATVTALDLLDFETELRARIAKVPTSIPNPGDWCFRCSSRRACPAQQRSAA